MIMTAAPKGKYRMYNYRHLTHNTISDINDQVDIHNITVSEIEMEAGRLHTSCGALLLNSQEINLPTRNNQ